MPAAGYRNNDNLNNVGSNGNYWSSCADTHHSDSGGMILFYSGGLSRNSNFRCYGLSVRPVCGDATLVSSVSLDKTELILHEGESNNLTGTVYPETAVNKSISWESSNADVATVDSNGNVTGISKGSAIITVTTADCSKTATCSVTVINTLPDGAVDLGLSVYWASCNLGASSPEDSGGYYQWAGTNDVTDTSIYLDWSNCPYHTGSDKNTGWTKYIPSDKSSYWSGSGSPDNKTVLDPEDDVAHVKLGGRWRMPTKEEWHELKAYCSWTEISLNGIYGFKIQSMKTGFTDNWIFLPAAGCRSSGSLKAAGSSGSYWYPSLSLGSPDDAYYLYFSPNGVFMLNGSYRYLGLSVRPVSE